MSFSNTGKGFDSRDEQVESALSPKALAAGTSENSYHEPKKEHRLVLKQDLIILPLLSLGYFFGYLDRGNIGNARLMGMPKALGLDAQEYFNVLMIFFVGFLVAELPCALLMRMIPAQFVFGGAIILFGLCATCMVVAGGYAGLMVLRTILGMGEAVLTLGFLYLSLWYRPNELAFRSGLLYCSTPVAGFASGLIAYGVAKHLEGVRGYASWQWLFLIEGVITIALGLVVIILLPSFPDRIARTGHFLFKNSSEKELMLARQLSGQNSANAEIVPGQLWTGLKDPKSYLGAIMVAAPALGITSFVLFLPTFLKEFGYTALDAQLFSIIPYAFAVVSTPLFCFVADRLRMKAMPMLFCLCTSIIGFIMLLAATGTVARMAGCCFVTAGSYPAIGIGASWVTSMHGGYTKRSTAFAISQLFVQSYSIIGTQIYDKPPRFLKGHGVVLGFFALAVASTLVLYFWLRKQNRERDAFVATGRHLSEGKKGFVSRKVDEELCDYHLEWRYPL